MMTTIYWNRAVLNVFAAHLSPEN